MKKLMGIFLLCLCSWGQNSYEFVFGDTQIYANDDNKSFVIITDLDLNKTIKMGYDKLFRQGFANLGGKYGAISGCKYEINDKSDMILECSFDDKPTTFILKKLTNSLLIKSATQTIKLKKHSNFKSVLAKLGGVFGRYTLTQAEVFTDKIEKGFESQYAKKMIDGLGDEIEQEGEFGDDEFTGSYFDLVDVALVYLNHDMLTTRLYWVSYQGGVHENYAVSYSSMVGQKKIKLGDIVEDVEKFKEIVGKNLHTKHASEIFGEASVESAENFYIKNGKIFIIFNPYEIAPFSSGIIEVSVNYDEIKSIINPNMKKYFK